MTDKQTIEKYVTDTEQSLIGNYKRMGLKASGLWERELEGKSTERPNGWRITFLGTKYTEQLIYGRRPNKDQSKKAIRAFVGWAGNTFLADWVKDKGLIANPFAVAYKIATKGIEVPSRFNTGDLLSAVFNTENLDGLLSSLRDAKLNEIREIWR